MSDHYATLGIERGASELDITRAWRRCAKQYHPDREGGDAEKFRLGRIAYETLSDPFKRQEYDTLGGMPSGKLEAMSPEYVEQLKTRADVDGICSTCRGTRKVKVAVNSFAYRNMPCPKCGEVKS